MRASTAVAVAGFAVGAAFVPLRLAQAQWAGCTPGTLTVCAAFNASVGQVNGTWHLYLKVWNLYGGSGTTGLSHVITFAGIGSSWSGTATLKSATFDGSPVKWTNDGSPNNNVVGALIDVGARSKKGATQGLDGPVLDLDFTTSSQFTFGNVVYGWHSQAVDGTGCSLWGDSKGHSTNTSLSDCTGVVPEPVTMALLATGLVGLGGVGFIRRRRRGLEEDGRAV